MKSTKNFLIISPLVIALFISVQVSAMASKINPYLTQQQKTRIENTLGLLKFFRDTKDCDPKKKLAPQDRELCQSYLRVIQQLETIYYSNKSYTDKEINNAEE